MPHNEVSSVHPWYTIISDRSLTYHRLYINQHQLVKKTSQSCLTCRKQPLKVGSYQSSVSNNHRSAVYTLLGVSSVFDTYAYLGTSRGKAQGESRFLSSTVGLRNSIGISIVYETLGIRVGQSLDCNSQKYWASTIALLEKTSCNVAHKSTWTTFNTDPGK